MIHKNSKKRIKNVERIAENFRLPRGISLEKSASFPKSKYSRIFEGFDH
jgi:hypothetical protein